MNTSPVRFSAGPPPSPGVVIASIAPPLAHAGHWAISLLFFAPILIVIALVAVQSVRDRRRGMQPAADWPDPSGDPSNAEP